MRLGACALVIATAVVLAPTPAQAKVPAHALEVVNTSIAEVVEYVDSARQMPRRTERRPVRESLQRDKEALQDLRARLLDGDVTGTSAKEAARRTASCAEDKVGYAIHVTERLRAQIAEITAAGEAALEAYDPGGENADRIEELVNEAYEDRDRVADQISPIIAALARVRCSRPAATFEQSVAEYDTSQMAFDDAYDAIWEATRLVEQQSGG